MAFTIKEEPRKAEMTSMIDMIFLLLIFFLVTLAIGQNTGEEGEAEGVIDNPSEINIARPTIPNVATADSISGRVFKISVFSISKKEDIPAAVSDPLRKQYEGNLDYPIFAVYWLDSVFPTPLSVEDSFQVWTTPPRAGTPTAKKALQEYERYRPLILPPNSWFTANSARANEHYQQVIENTRSFFEILKSQSSYREDSDDVRLTIVFDADEDLYYRFLFDLNDVYYKIDPDNSLLTSPIPGKIMIGSKSINSR